MTYLEEMFSLKGRRIVMTGGAGGIPAELAIGLAKAGADVCLWGRGTNHPMAEAAAAVRAAVGEGGSGSPAGRIESVTIDTADSAACESAILETEKLIGAPNVLVNGVGGNRGKAPFVDMDEKIFMEVVQLNLMAGLVTPTRAFARWWMAKGIKGSVINMSSMASYVPLSGTWAYDAAKAGVLNLTAALAKEFAPHGIRVNGIAPGFFIGNQNRALLIDEKSGDLTPRGKSIIAHTPFGRFGEKSELRGATIFLASEAAAGFVTGVQLQRVAIARALVHGPKLILADEPTGNLDAGNAQRVMDVLMEQSRAHRTACLLVTHSHAAASRAHRVMELRPDGLFIA